MRWIAFAGFGAFLCLVASAAARPLAHVDSPRIVPWTQIGAARLLDTPAAADRSYGRPVKTEDLSRAIPYGTRWHGHRVVDRTYRVSGGTLWVRTVDGRIRGLSTTSRRYSTPRGIRVGRRIPMGPCRPNARGGCVYSWHEFGFDDCAKGWRADRRRLVVVLGMHKGRVAEVEFGDRDALLICF